MKGTKIEWCDHTVNLWHGCTKVSPGCANCYAEEMSRRFGKDIWGPGKAREDHRKGAIKTALRLDGAAAKGRFVQCKVCGRRESRKLHCCGSAGELQVCSGWELGCVAPDPERDSRVVRPRVFSASMSDWLDDEVPVEWLADLLDLIRQTPNLDWLLLTKRPENFRFRLNQVGWSLDDKPDSDKASNELREWLADWLFAHRPPANVWIGTSVEDQQRADERIVQLMEIPARLRFLSCEPLLGPVDLSAFMGQAPDISGDRIETYNYGIDWVIAGGESGPKARPMHPDWARSLRDQCQASGVPFFFKQWGEWAPGHTEGFTERQSMTEKHWSDGNISVRIGKKTAGRMIDGREWNEFPKGGGE